MKTRNHYQENRRRKKLAVSSQLSNIHSAASELATFIAHSHLDKDELQLVISEAIANAMVHGNKRDPRKKVIATACVEPRKVVLKIADQGNGFDYDKVPDPVQEENLHKGHGRGLFLIRHFTDKVQFNRRGNEITMTKYLN